MIRINLLPFRAARKKENVRRQVSIFLLSLVFLAVAMAWLTIYMNHRIKTLTSRLETAKVELAKYETINKEIEEIKKQLAILEKRTELINNLEKNRVEAVKILDQMTEVIVRNRMWFTSLSASDPFVTVDGVAMDNKTISDFMARLEATKMYKSVELKFSKQTTMGKVNLKSFEIICEKVAQLPTTEKPKAA
jgi:type IV pilus assembly protein PilN